MKLIVLERRDLNILDTRLITIASKLSPIKQAKCKISQI